jgi:hypothetical protein
MTEMSADSLKNNLTNPARTYLWEVLFATPVGGDTDTFLYRCRSTSQPGRSVGKIHLPYKQTGGVEYPGKLTYSHSWACSFIEGEDRAMFDALYDWAQAVVNDKTGLGQAVLKTDAYLNLIDTDGTTSLKIKFVGAYLESIDEVALAQESENEIVYPAVWSYDRWEKVS